MSHAAVEEPSLATPVGLQRRAGRSSQRGAPGTKAAGTPLKILTSNLLVSSNETRAQLLPGSKHSNFLPRADAPAANPFGHGRAETPSPTPETRQGFSKPWKKAESFAPRTYDASLKHRPIRSKVTSLALLLDTSPARTSTKTEAKAQDMGNPSDT